jgi:isocitrate/isopropylmalate dehydrogenase
MPRQRANKPPTQDRHHPGDGIGKEVMPEGLRVLEAAASRFDIDLQFQHIDWAAATTMPRTAP